MQRGGGPDPQEVDRILALYNQERYAEAITFAQALTVRFPMFGFGWKIMGVLLCQLGRATDAIEPMRKAAVLSTNDDEAHFNLGNVLKEAGRLNEAVTSYRKALAINPKSAEAYGNLGVTLQNLGRLDEAVASYRRVLTIKPDSEGAHFNLANALNDLKRHEDAVASYRKALAIAPDFPEAHFNLGASLQSLKRPEEAIESYRRALAINPHFAEAHFNMGNAMKALGRLDAAVACYQQALATKPDYAEACFNLGNALTDLKQIDEAMASYRRALAIKPNYAEACFSLSSALHESGRPEDAAASYRRVLEIRLDYAEAHNNLGNVLKDLGRFADAAASYARALEIRPGYVEAQTNRGTALQDMGRVDDAVECYRRALEIKPDYAEAHFGLGTALQELGRVNDAMECYRRALEIKPDYAEAQNNTGASLQELGRPESAVAGFHRALQIRPDFAAAHSNLLFTLAYHGLTSSAALLNEALKWQAQVVPETTGAVARLREFSVLPQNGRRLRVGYVSGDFRQHAVSYFIEPLFSLHDRGRIELFAYSTNSRRDQLTERLKGMADHWRDIAGLSDEAARQRIEADAIDVLIDLSGHTGHNRLGVFALRAAPVQAHYLGYFATTGLTEMDYWLGDPIILPESEDAHYSETIWRLPRVWVSYHGQDEAPLPNWSPREDGTVLLGSFNNLKKLTPATLVLWAKLLRAIPEARLMLKTWGLAEPANRTRIEDEMNAHGIGSERLELIGTMDRWSSHMVQYDRLDIALDPIGGVGGGTTTCDALWMGVPVVTLAGRQMIHRMTASMLDSIGHREWIAETEDDYVAKVVALARDVEQRRSLRHGQRDRVRNSPLCDAAGLARSLEDAYEAMFDVWCQRKSGARNTSSAATDGRN